MMMMMVMMERKEGRREGGRRCQSRRQLERDESGEGTNSICFCAHRVPDSRGEDERARGTEEDALAVAVAVVVAAIHSFPRCGWEMLDPPCAASPLSLYSATLSLSTMIEF